MTLADGTRVAPTGVRVRTLSNGDSLLIMRLNQGLNRQIRKMCDKVGLTILSLKRVAEGGLKLGDLKSGQYRPLTAKEVDSLNNSCARRK
ncbi:MAG: pseudouridine synthase, partial [Desulfovibrio sp.]|nr:pseudouridine synthase [Desulfovibrio sp.]